MKKTWIVVITALIAIVVISGYTAFDHFFPKAAPISCPDIESIITITLIQNNGNSVPVEPAAFGEILKNITSAQPTRTMSVNDHPTAKAYYTIEIDTVARQYRYFLYTKHSQVYIELPYEGIYKANQQFSHYVAEYFKD